MLAPLAVNVAVPAGQMVALFTVIVGEGFTVTCTVFVPEHPPLVPFKVYVVIIDGETLIDAVFGPVFQV